MTPADVILIETTVAAPEVNVAKIVAVKLGSAAK